MASRLRVFTSKARALWDVMKADARGCPICDATVSKVAISFSKIPNHLSHRFRFFLAGPACEDFRHLWMNLLQRFHQLRIGYCEGLPELLKGWNSLSILHFLGCKVKTALVPTIILGSHLGIECFKGFESSMAKVVRTQGDY